MAERKITIGVFLGLITKKGKLRLQRRIEKGSAVLPGVSFKGDFELTGGGVKEKDLGRVLTFLRLFHEAQREAEEELGVLVVSPIGDSSLYRAVFVNQERGTEDWAFMIPILPVEWDETAKMKREIIDVSPEELRELAGRPKGEQLLSGWGKRMCRMSLAALYILSSNRDYQKKAESMLNEIKPDWEETEFYRSGGSILFKLRKELGFK